MFGLHYGRCTLFLAIIKTEKKIISAEITSQASHFAAGKENKPQCTISVSKPFIVDVLFLQWLFNYTIFIYFFTFLQDTHSLLCFHYRAFIQNSHISQQKKKKITKKTPLPSVPLTHRHSRPCNVGVLGLSGEGGDEKAAALWLRLSESGIAVISVFRCNRSLLPSGVNNNKHKYNRQTRSAGHISTHTHTHTGIHRTINNKCKPQESSVFCLYLEEAIAL